MVPPLLEPMGNNSTCSSTIGSTTGTGAAWLTRPALDFFFFFFPPIMAASPPHNPHPQSDKRQQSARMPRRIQSHRRLLDEFSVVVVTAVGAVVCAPWVVCALAVVDGPGPAVVEPRAAMAPATARAVAPAITPPMTAPWWWPGPGAGPGASVVPQGFSE